MYNFKISPDEAILALAEALANREWIGQKEMLRRHIITCYYKSCYEFN